MTARSRKREHAALLRRAHKDGTYDRLLELQGGLCAICGRPQEECCVQKDGSLRRFDIDHDHRTMKIRGLLDRGCNMKLRRDHDPEWMRAAADYLETPPSLLLHCPCNPTGGTDGLRNERISPSPDRPEAEGDGIV